MRFMLDTNICIYVIRNHPASVRQRFQQHSTQDLVVSSITLAEMEFGVAKSAFPERNAVSLNSFVQSLTVVPFGNSAAHEYGLVRTHLERQGQAIGPLDMLIAAHAKSLGLTMVTNNVREFSRVPGLAVENWLE